MEPIQLVVGNKNYSSWSLRAWLALKLTGAPFTETVLPLRQPGWSEAIARWSPGGKVPALRHGEVIVWESLAICEYLAETFPGARLWPEDPAARAHARAICSEMHAGFTALRENMPYDLRSTTKRGAGLTPAVEKDIARICAIWSECRARWGGGGDFLFGRFTLADAFYAPVAGRFRTYAPPLDAAARAYVEAIFAFPAMREWQAAAERETFTPPY
jgi:glutathione S-transferase